MTMTMTMKLIVLLAIISVPLAAQDANITPSKLNEALILQRNQLVSAHTEQLTTASADFKARLEAVKADFKAKLGAAEKRASDAEAALKAADEKLAEAAPFIEAAKSEKTKKREALAAEIAAKQAELAKLKP